MPTVKHPLSPRPIQRSTKRRVTRTGALRKIASNGIAVEYYVRVDSKKRVTIRGADVDTFRVAEMRDGTVVLVPRVENKLSAAELRCIGKSIASMKAGKRSRAVDLKELAAMRL